MFFLNRSKSGCEIRLTEGSTLLSTSVVFIERLIDTAFGKFTFGCRPLSFNPTGDGKESEDAPKSGKVGLISVIFRRRGEWNGVGLTSLNIRSSYCSLYKPLLPS